MKRQIKSILISMLMIISTAVIIPRNVDAMTTPPQQISGQGQQWQIDRLDYTYIREITDWLSNVIINSYNQNPGQPELAKGRDFGSNGERDAADYIEYQMDNILNLESVNKDPINSTDSDYEFRLKTIQNLLGTDALLSQYETNSIALTINHGTEHTTLDDSEFFISPYWGFLHEINTENYLDDSQVQYGPFNEVKIVSGSKIDLFFWTYILFHLPEIRNYIFNSNPNSNEVHDFIKNLIEEDYDFSFENIDPNNPGTIPSFWEDVGCPPIGFSDQFVVISEDSWNNMNNPIFKIIYNYLNPYALWAFGWRWMVLNLTQESLHWIYDDAFLGNVLYDMSGNEGVHDMPALDYTPLPVICINGNWKEIMDNPDEYTIDFTLDETFQRDVESYNVFGEIEGEDSSKTLMVDCLYDGRWNQATADAAIGMGVVLGGIAKVMKTLESEYDISPKYNVKFVAFAGEEAGFRGAYDYNKKYENENINYIIDLNQLGFTERFNHLTLNVFMNNFSFSNKIRSLIDETNYVQCIGGASDFIVKYLTDRNIQTGLSDFYPFINREDIKTMCFLEDTGWSLHHRTGGQQYEYGDVMDYYDEIKVKTAGEMIWNVTKYLAYDHKSSFDDSAPQTFVREDVDDDGKKDSIKATFTVNTEFPHDRVTIRAKLFTPLGICKMITRQDFDINYFSKQCAMTITLPPTATLGFYKIELELLNATERIEDKLHKNIGPLSPFGTPDDNIDSGLSYLFLYPRGNTKPNMPTFDPLGGLPIIAQHKKYYNCNVVDPDGDRVSYSINWNLYNQYSPEIPYFSTVASGENFQVSNTYLTGGWKKISVRCRENYENLFDWSLCWNKRGSYSDKLYAEYNVRGEVGLGLTLNPQYSLDSYQGTINQPFNIYSVPPLNYNPINYTWTVMTEGKAAQKYYTESLSHNFTEIDISHVNLTMTNELGTKVSIEVPVNVSNLTAGFTTNWNHSIEKNDILFFNDTSTGVNNITNLSWDFGDDTNATGRFVNHSYILYGDYNVTLTIHDNKSNTSVFQKVITVNPDFEPPTLTNISYDILQNDSPLEVLLIATVTDPGRGVDSVKINITNPTGEQQNYTMDYYIDDIYYLSFTNVTTSGDYTYTLWAVDNVNNSNTTLTEVFTVPSVFGNTLGGDHGVSVEDRITGSNFTIPEYGAVDSITALIHLEQGEQQAEAQAVIYRVNDSTLMGVSEEVNPEAGSTYEWVMFNFTDPKPVLESNIEYILSIWCDRVCMLNYTVSTGSNGRYVSSTYDGTPPEQASFSNENRLYSIYCCYTSDASAEINNITASPGHVGYGLNVTISAEITDPISGIEQVNVSVTSPDNSTGNYTMMPPEPGINEYILVFDDTNQLGEYTFTIWVTDKSGKINSSSGYFFIVHTKPYLSFDTPPTPVDNNNQTQTWVQANVTVQDNLSTSAFINWNHTLCGYWSMDTYNSTGIYDNSTFDNFGKFDGGMNTSNIKPGKYGNALEFDGRINNVDIGNDYSLRLGTGNFTFMVWEKSDVSSYPFKAVFLTNRPDDANAKGYCFGVFNKSYLYVTQELKNNVTLNGNTDVTDNAWHHIAYVRKGTNYSIYVDGAYDAGVTGGNKNITNNQHTYLSCGNRENWAYFDGKLDEPQLYNRALSREEINASYNNGLYQLYHNFTGLANGHYEMYAHAINSLGNQSTSEIRLVTVDTRKPAITNVNGSPHSVGFGGGVNITTNITDSGSGVYAVFVNISYPNTFWQNYTMYSIGGNTYNYMFYDTWLTGQYNYTIWAVDNTGNMNNSSGHHLHVSAEGKMSIATLKDSYSGSQYINITDPPNPPENLTLIGRGLSWNTYYNASSGENILETYQGPVNYQDDNDSWTPINNTISQLATNHPAYVYGYRTGNDRGLFGAYFKSNSQNDWPVAFTYNRSDDPTVHVVRSKLVGVGYVDPQTNWAYQYLQNVQSSQGQTNDYSITYPGVFTGTDVTWSYSNTGMKEEITLSNTTKTVLQNHPPSQYGFNDASSYLVFITKLDYQNLNLYNNSGLLDGNVTISETGVDFKDALGQFKCALPLGEAYELNNETARQKLTYRIIHLNGNTYLLSGLKVSKLNTMTFPVVIDPTLTVYSTSSDGYIYKSGTVYTTVQSASTGTVDSSGTYITIGQKKISFPGTYYIYRGFVFFNTSALPSNAYLDNATLSLYKKDDYSTTDFDITIQNGQPTYPHNPMQSGDYYRNYYSGNGGTLNTGSFTSGYNAIKLNNLNWINKTGVTKLCLRSSRDISGTAPTGNEYINVHSYEFTGIGCQPKLVINYRNQSKIKNTGSTNIKGYLLIQIQFYNTSQGKWIVDWNVDNETVARIVNSSSQLPLDAIFNGLIRASDLSYGTGIYRAYTAFRDPSGNVLRTNDGTELNAWWQFTKT